MNSSHLQLTILIVLSNTILFITSVFLAYVLITNSEEVDYDTFHVDPQFFGMFTQLLLITSLFVCVICLLGFCGVFINNAFYLLMCTVMFAVLAIVETATVYILYPDKEKFKNGLEARWLEIMNNDKEWNIVHNFQETHKCCGWNSFDDWQTNELIGKVPGSCCEKRWNETCTNENDLRETIGCKIIVDEYLRNILSYLPYIIPLVFLFEIILIVSLFWNIVAHSNDNVENDYLIKLGSNPAKHRLSTLIDGIRYEESANTHIQMKNFSAGYSGESSSHIEINLFDETAL